MDHGDRVRDLAAPDRAVRSVAGRIQFVEEGRWLASTIGYKMGVDGISLPFVILTTALMPFCIVAS